MTGDGDCGEIGGMKIGRGNRSRYSEKISPIATLSTTNPTCLDPGLNPGRRRRRGKPATNRLSYGAAFKQSVTSTYSLHHRRTAVRQRNVCFIQTQCGGASKVTASFVVCLGTLIEVSRYDMRRLLGIFQALVSLTSRHRGYGGAACRIPGI
jgi:hypothetical protein